MTAPINIHIDELVLPANSRRTADELATELTNELHSLLLDRGLSGARSVHVEQISQQMSSHQWAGRTSSAPNIAASIYHGISGSTGGDQ